MSDPKTALSEWVKGTLGPSEQRELSKLIAAYVADSVRSDRVKLAEERKQHEALKKQIREGMEKVSAMHRGTPQIDTSLFGQIFGPSYRR